MATPREMLDRIRLRAWAVVIGSGGEVTFAEAQRAAAQEIAREERQRKRASDAAPMRALPSEVTPSNARAWLTNKLAEIAARLAASAHLTEQTPPPVRKPHASDRGHVSRADKFPVAAPPIAPISKQDPEPEPTPQIIGGVIFGTTSTAQRIPDSEYAPRFHDHVTENWRASIERNERIAREKQQRSRWIG
jgi:hypothetical protein